MKVTEVGIKKAENLAVARTGKEIVEHEGYAGALTDKR